MAGGSTDTSGPPVVHLTASVSEQTVIALHQAGYGHRLRGLGDPFQVVFDGDGVRLHERGAPTDPNVASDWRAFIPWADVSRVGLAAASLPGPGDDTKMTRHAITITAHSVEVPLVVDTSKAGSRGLLNGGSVSMVQLARRVNSLRGMPEARVNASDLMREAVPELDPVRRRLAADPQLESRTVDELLGEVVRREPIYGPSSESIRSRWRVVRTFGGSAIAIGIPSVVVALVWDVDWLRGAAAAFVVVGGIVVRLASGRYAAVGHIVVSELEAGYTLSRLGPTQVDQLDATTAIVIRRAGERALTRVEEESARSAARLLDAGGPEVPPSEWAVRRAREIISRGEDPEVAPSPASGLNHRDVVHAQAHAAPVWGTSSGEAAPARHPLLAGRHSRSIAWYRRSDLERRRAAEHDAGYTVSRTLRPDLDQVDPVSGYVIRPGGGASLSASRERAAMARVRMLPR